jgi:hypothetical protein
VQSGAIRWYLGVRLSYLRFALQRADRVF